jgi:hypothetical protein
MADACKQVQTVFKLKTTHKKNRQGFFKTTAEIKKAFSDFILLFYEGGSANKPYIVFDLLTVLEGREYNAWNEKCLTGFTFLVNFEPRIIDDIDATYNISEHAIARLFLRTKPKFKGDVIDCMYIRNEMKLLPFWANYWALTLSLSEEYNFQGSCFPVIPTPSGLFMSEYSIHSKYIEVRTFVDDIQLNFEQLEVKKLLNEVSNDVIESPLSFLLLVTTSRIERLELLHGVITNRLRKHKNYPILKNIFFHRIEDDNLRFAIKNKFDILMKKYTSLTNFDILDEELKKIGIKKFQLTVKKALLSSAK